MRWFDSSSTGSWRGYAIAVLLLGCGREPAQLQLDLGREGGALDEAPRPTRWQIDFVDESNTSTTLGSGSWPSAALDMDLAPDSIGSFAARFFGDAERELVFGQSPSIAVAQLVGRTLPLFVQRRGSFARPSPDLDGRAAPLLALAGRRVLVVGGGSSLLAAHDLAFGRALSGRDLGFVPRAIAATNAAVYALQETRVMRLDLADNALEELILPSEIDRTELDGSALMPLGERVVWAGPCHPSRDSSTLVVLEDRVVRSSAPLHAFCNYDADGALWMVNAERALRLHPDGSLHETPLTLARTPRAMALPSDGSLVMAIEETDAIHVRRIDARCLRGEGSCEAEDRGAIGCADAAAAAGEEVLFVCDDGGVVRHKTEEALAPLPTREARNGARPIVLGADELALVGGGPASFERYRPR